MKNRLQKIYILTIAILTLVSIDTPVEYKIRQLISDDSLLIFHYESNSRADTTVTLINMANYPMDTVQKWVKRILEFKPKVIAVDSFSDTLYNIDKLDGTIILPIISEDGEYFEYSINNITTRQTYGVALVNDYFRINKFFKDDSRDLPAFAMQIVKEYSPEKYSEIIKNEKQELIDYIPTISFQIIASPDYYPDGILEAFIKDKIVIIGYLGHSHNHIPDILDHNDSHLTPIGKLFGPIILANQVQTLLGNRIRELNKPVIILISLIILLLTFFLIQRIESNKGVLIIVSLNMTLALLLGLLLLASMLLLEKYNFFLSIKLIALSLTLGIQAGIVTKLTKE